MKTVLAIVVLVCLAGCSAQQAPVEEEEPVDSSNASLACDHFRNIAGDIASGVLTVSELREKLKEVADNASIAPATVQLAATQLVSTVTQDNAAGFAVALSSMDEACTGAGA